MALTDEQRSAKALIEGTLARYGLSSLATWAWNLYLDGAVEDQVMLELRQRPEYKTRFSGMDALAAKGRAITEQAYIDYERSAASLFRAYGLPVGFYDQPSDFAKFIGGEVSLKELEDRMKVAQASAFTAPEETRQKLADLYGIQGGGLTAYWFNPDLAMTLLTQQYTAASLAGEAQRQGLTVGRTQAERLGTLGITEDQARQGFGTAAAARELAMTLPGELATQVGQEDLVSAAFGTDQAATQRVRTKSERRKAAFAGTGSYASGQQGITGLGAADQLG